MSTTIILAQHEAVAYFGSKGALDIIWLSDWLLALDLAFLYADLRLGQQTWIVSSLGYGKEHAGSQMWRSCLKEYASRRVRLTEDRVQRKSSEEGIMLGGYCGMLL